MTNFETFGTALPVRIHRWKDDGWEAVNDIVAEEIFIRVFVDGGIYGSLVCSPWDLDELVVGYLFTDGVISRYSDIAGLEIKGDTVLVKLHAPAGEEPVFTSRPPCRLTAPTVLRLASEMETSSRLFRHTGCVHNAALANNSEILTHCEDVGRHNALDRLIGRCLIQGIPLLGRVIVFSGRVPEEIIRKVVRVGCSVIISVSAPTSMALTLAEEEGIMLIGFARGNRFNVYTHPEMLLY